MSYLGKQPAFVPVTSADVTNALGFTPIQLSSLSATQNLTYNATTGQFTGPDLSSYLTSATAASTYQTQAGMSSYLTTSSASSTYFPLAGGTISGNLTFSGTSRRITGDFSSNSPITDRILVQTSTTNANTLFSLLPNGTSTTTRYVAFNNSDPTNSSALQLSALSTDVRLQSFANGTASVVPLLLMMGGTTVAAVGTNNNFGIGTGNSPSAKLHVVGTESRLEGTATLQSFYSGSSTRVGYVGGSDTALQVYVDSTYPIEFYTNATKRFEVGSSGQLGIGATPSYGTSGQALISGGASSAPSWGTLGATGGGTGQSTYATGDLLYASAANTLSKLGAGTNGQVLTLVSGVPAWAAASGGGGGISTGKSVAMSMIFGF
jgi:hypothetical protein